MNNGEILEVIIKSEDKDRIIGEIDGTNVTVVKPDDYSLEIGHPYFGMVYEDRYGELRADLKIPEVSLTSFGRGVVNEIDPKNGVFVNIGLVNKDILVSLDLLPDHHRNWPQVGDELIIKLERDNKNRLWGQLATDEDLIAENFINHDHKFQRNEMVLGTIYHVGKTGAFVLLKQGRFGYLHESECLETIRLGEAITARVIGFGGHDRINVSMLPNAYARIDDDASMILAAIKFNPNKKLQITDKSTPDEIKAKFGISKASFKRAVGHLLKEKLISEENGYLKIRTTE